MISSVSGIIEDKGTDYVEINLGVIGLKILTSQRDISQMPKTGEHTKLYTFLKVKEDDMQLYGFTFILKHGNLCIWIPLKKTILRLLGK